MAYISERILSDLSKIKGSAGTRSSAKSRAKAETRQQINLLSNLAKAAGNLAINAFVKKAYKIEKSLKAPKSFNQRVMTKFSFATESNPSKAQKGLKAHIKYITRESAGDTLPFTDNERILDKSDLKAFGEGATAENEKIFRILISPERAEDFRSDDDFHKYICECMKQLSDDLGVTLADQHKKYCP
jgi:hypothetical protein